MPTRSVTDAILAAARWKRIEVEARRALTWWLDELASLLPVKLRSSLARWRLAEPELILSTDGLQWRRPDGSEVRWLVRNGRLEPTSLQDGAVFADRVNARARLSMGLSEQLFLVRELTLPMAASALLPAVVRHQVSRLVPLSGEEIVSTSEVLSRDSSSKTMLVRVILARQATLACAQVIAQQLNFELRRVIASKTGMRPRDLLLSKTTSRASLAGIVRRNARTTLALFTAVAALSLHLIKESYIDARVKAEILDLQLHTAAVLALDGKVRSERSLLAYVHVRQRELPPTAVLDDLAKLLPLDTWLSQLTLQNGSIICAGESLQADRLIGRVEASKVFMSPKFISAITMAADGSAERFELRLTIRPDGRS